MMTGHILCRVAPVKCRRSTVDASQGLQVDNVTLKVYSWTVQSCSSEKIMKADPSVKSKKNADAIALKAAFTILDKWGANAEQQQNILQLAKATYYKHRAGGEPKLTSDQLTRISYLLNIHSALRTVFENPTNIYGFMAMPNKNAYFNGAAPLSLIGANGDFGTLYEVAKRVDMMRGGLWG